MVASVDFMGPWRRIGNHPDHKSKGSPVEIAEVLRKHGSLMVMASVEAAPVCRNELLRFLCGE